jgi:meso-butanediol dehydrogenase/(S,S)-butanediol dehydrogenase/diacetyl reductase
MRLQNKVALITGGGGGIGSVTAEVFCREGAAVVLVDMSNDALQEKATRIKSANPNARVETFAADVSDARAAVRAVALAKGKFGGLDILVNNAAMRNYSALADVTPEEWIATVQVNLIGTSNYIKAALPLLRESGKGSVVNVGSAYGVMGRKGMGLYDTTKAGLIGLTRTLAHEEAQNNVRANVMCPGSTLTEFHIERYKAKGVEIEDLKTQRSDTSLLKRWGAPEEMAYPILWLASDEASYITGSTLVVDGGLHVM